MDDIANLFGDLNNVVTNIEPEVERPKRFIFTRIEGTNDLLLRIDNSSLEVQVTCARAAEYKLIHSREAHPGPALAFGNRIHECLEHLYNNAFDEKTYRECLRILEYRFAKQPFPSDEWRSLEFAVAVIQKYVTKYQLDLDTFEPLAVETPFSLPLCVLAVDAYVPYSPHKLLGIDSGKENTYIGDIHVYWSGKIDMVARARATDAISFWDHKTSSVMGEQFFNGFKQNQQTVGYAWAVKRIHEFDFVPGFLLNALGIRKPTRTGTAIELERMPYQYTQAQLDEWEVDMQHLVNQFVQNMVEGYFPKMTQWCFGKFSQCPYFGVCMCDTTEQRFAFLNSSAYHNVSWTPFETPPPVDLSVEPLNDNTILATTDQLESLKKFL